MISPRTKRAGILSLILFVCSVVVFSILIYVVYDKKKDFEMLVVERANLIAENEKLDELVERVEDTVEERNTIENHFLDKNSAIDFLALIETLAREQGVEIKVATFDPEEIPGSTVFGNLVFSVDVIGSYDAVVHTLDIFETLPYQTEIYSVNINHVGGDADAWNGRYSMKITQKISS